MGGTIGRRGRAGIAYDITRQKGAETLLRMQCRRKESIRRVKDQRGEATGYALWI